ncbi:TerB family tellurite resistance protein [Xanthobacteraceae bacterium Astr-EGSB]|uniref:tellurite resistance TerB family protein n=1 Tax=Astrobacterium formosum TaxID=3069710 RepID=UPI0027B46A6E|nr:TerB family tellurite resistance protein [Xanthobacteraceae bacterium Astr-EGSB]
MLEDIKRFFSDLVDDGKEQAQFCDNDYRLAAAALMVHVATLDGALSDAERGRLIDLVKARFELDDEKADELVTAAQAADREAVDFFRFTSILMRSLDEAGRQRIIEMMWEMALSDGAVSEFEDNAIWRIADLLAVSGAQRIGLRQRVASRLVAAGEA